MKKQQLLLKSKRSQISPSPVPMTTSENEYVDSEDQILSEKITRTFLEANQQKLKGSLIQFTYAQTETNNEMNVTSTSSTVSSTATSEEHTQKNVGTGTSMDGCELDFVPVDEIRDSRDEGRSVKVPSNPPANSSQNPIAPAKKFHQPLVLDYSHRITQMEND